MSANSEKFEYCNACDAPLVRGFCKRCEEKRRIEAKKFEAQKIPERILTRAEIEWHSFYYKKFGPPVSSEDKLQEIVADTKQKAAQAQMSAKDYCMAKIKKLPLGKMFLNNLEKK